MQRTIKLLAGLLGVQLLLALALGLADLGFAGRAEGSALLVAVDKDRIDRIAVKGPADGETVALARRDGQWVLPDAGDFPADGERVQQLIDRLAALKAGVPVATSSGARERFRVDDEAFERRIALAAGEQTLATLYLGTSPGMRRIHARADGQHAIHAVALAAYDVPAKPADWEDKTLLQMPKEEIQAIEIGDLRIERVAAAAGEAGSASDQAATASDKAAGQGAPGGAKGGEVKTDAAKPDDEKPGDEKAGDEKAGDEKSGDVKAGAAGHAKQPEPVWKAEGIDPGRRLRPEAADRLAGLLAGLRFDHVLGREAKPEYGLDKPLLDLTLTRKGGDKVAYRVGKAPDAEAYTLKVSNRPEFLRLASTTAKSLVEAAGRETLVQAPEGDGQEKPAD